VRAPIRPTSTFKIECLFFLIDSFMNCNSDCSDSKCSALLAENVVVPMLVIYTVHAYIANFHQELDQ
jgi:hypothetical protein